jgi:hypothetical protein
MLFHLAFFHFCLETKVEQKFKAAEKKAKNFPVWLK